MSDRFNVGSAEHTPGNPFKHESKARFQPAMPQGGKTGQVLTKNSDKENDAGWGDVGAGEKKSKSISTPEGVTGQVDWILIKLSEQTSLISIWGELITPDTLPTGDYVQIISSVDEPLFERFVGVVNKLHLAIADNELIAGQMQYTGAGAAFVNAFGMGSQMKFTFQDILVLTTL